MEVNTIAGMGNCAVLRCTESARASFIRPEVKLDVPVCAGHAKALGAGAAWMLHPSSRQSQGGNTDPAEVRILMEQDLPAERLTGFGASPTVGSELGFSVVLTIDAAEGPQQIAFWMPVDFADAIRSFLASPPEES